MTFSPSTALAIAETLERADSSATPAPWEWSDDGVFLFNASSDDGVLNHAGCYWPVSQEDRDAIASLRNTAREAAEQLRSAVAEVERLTKGHEGLADAYLAEQKRADDLQETAMKACECEGVGHTPWCRVGKADEHRKLRAQLATAERERDEARAEIDRLSLALSDSYGELDGLRSSEAFFRRRAEVLESAAKRRLTRAEQVAESTKHLRALLGEALGIWRARRAAPPTMSDFAACERMDAIAKEANLDA